MQICILPTNGNQFSSVDVWLTGDSSCIRMLSAFYIGSPGFRKMFDWKLLLILCLSVGVGQASQRYDGWYNNLERPSAGSVKSPMIYKALPAYADGTRQPAGPSRPGPGLLSGKLFSPIEGSTPASGRNLNVLFAFFGQLVANDIVGTVSTGHLACPSEPLPFQIGSFGNCAPDLISNRTICEAERTRMNPFMRSAFDQSTGLYLNSPRKPINYVTPFLDAGVVYGTSTPWTDAMRSFVDGHLMADARGYPPKNTKGIPLATNPAPTKHPNLTPIREQYATGDYVANQSPVLLALSILIYRYHNAVAKDMKREHVKWGDERVFQKTRKYVTAVWQNVVMYEFLPLFIDDTIPEYSGYRPEVDPSVSVEFGAAAFRFGHSLIPGGLYLRNSKCLHRRLALCRTWWDSMKYVDGYGMESVLRGAASQLADNGDHVFATSVKDNLFGGLRMNRADLPATNIQRGREQGLSDYNTVRQRFGLDRVENWTQINPELYNSSTELFDVLADLYNDDLSDVDLYVGGMLESTSAGAPGPLFSAIIKEQFLRIRDGDRFWFQNRHNGLFSDEQIREFRSTSFSSILQKVLDVNKDDATEPLTQPNGFHFSPQFLCPGQLPRIRLLPNETCTDYDLLDFFNGNETTFLLSLALLILMPVVCFAVCYLLAKRKKFFGSAETKNRQIKSTRRMADTFAAREYDPSSNEPPRQLQVKIVAEKCLMNVMCGAGRTLRLIKLREIAPVNLRISYDTEKHYLVLLPVPKEYDLILMFGSLEERVSFCELLQTACNAGDIDFEDDYLSLDNCVKGATTYSQRQASLKMFFTTAFDQMRDANEKKRAYDRHRSITTANQMSERVRARLELGGTGTLPPLRPAGSPYERTFARSILAGKEKSLLEVQINIREFAEALQLKPDSSFVQQMFTICDRDDDGYVSYPEFIDVLVLLSKGPLKDKMHLLFYMYDLDNNGTLSRIELNVMIRSLLDVSSKALSDEQVDAVIDMMLSESDLQDMVELSFEDFLKLIESHKSLMWAEAMAKETAVQTQSKDKTAKRRLRLNSASDASSTSTLATGTLPAFVIQRTEESGHWLKRRYEQLSYYLENNWNKVVIVTVYLLLQFLFFVYMYLTYFFYKEHTNIRKITGYTAPLSRGTAFAISFGLAVLVLTVLRNIWTYIRETPLGYYIPTDSAIEFHRIVALSIVPYIIGHILGHAANFYQVGTQPPAVLQCQFPEIAFPDDHIPQFHYWLYQTIPGLTGVLLVLVFSIMYVFATGYAREHIFKAFWVTHRLFPLAYILMFAHGIAGLIQTPFFPPFFYGPFLLYLVDWVISLRRHHVSLVFDHAETLPSGVLHLSFRQPRAIRFHSGQWARLACDALSTMEYHPFTITSAPHERRISFYIRSAGPWTRRMYSLIGSRLASGEPMPRMLLDGPYGSRHQDWYKFEVVVLVGAGIGVTPNASVLKDLVHHVYKQQRSPIAVKKVYFVWISRKHTQFEWFIDILKEIEEQDTKHLISMDIFVTQLIKDFDIRTMMLYICEHQFQRLSHRSLFTGLRATTHFGRIDFATYLQNVKRTNTGVSKIGVFCCGPKAVTRSVEANCKALNKQTPHFPTFVSHQEIF